MTTYRRLHALAAEWRDAIDAVTEQVPCTVTDVGPWRVMPSGLRDLRRAIENVQGHGIARAEVDAAAFGSTLPLVKRIAQGLTGCARTLRKRYPDLDVAPMRKASRQAWRVWRAARTAQALQAEDDAERGIIRGVATFDPVTRAVGFRFGDDV